MNNKIKKILFFSFFAISLNSLYIIAPWLINEIAELATGDHNFTSVFFTGFSYLTGTIFITQGIFLYLYFFRSLSKKRLIIITITILLFHSLLVFIPFNYQACDSVGFFSSKKECNCIGLEKNYLMHSECIGVRSECYRGGYEKPCNEVFPEK